MSLQRVSTVAQHGMAFTCGRFWLKAPFFPYGSQDPMKGKEGPAAERSGTKNHAHAITPTCLHAPEVAVSFVAILPV